MTFGRIAPGFRRAVAVLHWMLWLPLLVAACMPPPPPSTGAAAMDAPEPVVQPVSAYTQMLRDYGIPLDIPQRGKFIFVNIPSFELIAFEDGEPVMRSRVVVGKPSTETPDLYSYMYALKYNPDWTPTPMMIRNESAVYVPSGPNSPLGRVKFEMDNNQYIYLHDTNRPELYSRDRRAYSAGCVRVQNYLDLAAWVAGVPVDEIERNIRTGRMYTERLPEAVPVYLGYYIFFPNEQGQLVAHADLYGRGGSVPTGYHIVTPATNESAAVIAPSVEGMSYAPQPVSVAQPVPPPRPRAPRPAAAPAAPTPTAASAPAGEAPAADSPDDAEADGADAGDEGAGDATAGAGADATDGLLPEAAVTEDAAPLVEEPLVEEPLVEEPLTEPPPAADAAAPEVEILTFDDPADDPAEDTAGDPAADPAPAAQADCEPGSPGCSPAL